VIDARRNGSTTNSAIELPAALFLDHFELPGHRYGGLD
jgi:hypothetical protein